MLDQINSMTADASAIVAFRIIDAIQDLPKGQQARGIAMAFYMLTERYKVDPIDLLQKTRIATKDAYSQGRGEHVRAVQNYLNGELKQQVGTTPSHPEQELMEQTGLEIPEPPRAGNLDLNLIRDSKYFFA